MNNFDSLPVEVVLNVFSFLSQREMSVVSCVSRRCRSLVQVSLTSVNHLKLHRFECDAAINCISHYPNLTSLDVSDYSGCFKNILTDPVKREDFASRLSVHCPKIVTFVVPDIDGVRFVLDYINKKDVRVDPSNPLCQESVGIEPLQVSNPLSQESIGVKSSQVSNPLSQESVGIKSLQVFTLKTQTCSLVELFQLIERVVSPSFESLELGPMKSELPSGSRWLNQIESSWEKIGRSVRRFKLTNYDDWRPRSGDDLEQVVLSNLVGMESLVLPVVSRDEMELITTRNPSLISLQTDYMMGGFDCLHRLKRLKVLRIKELQNSPSNPSTHECEQVFRSVGGSLTRLELGLTHWTDGLLSIPNNCSRLKEVFIKVSLTVTSQKVDAFKQSFDTGINVMIKTV